MSSDSPKILVLGASFDTGNMGMSALAEGTLLCLFARWHSAEVYLQSAVPHPPLKLTIHGQPRTIHFLELWSGRNWLKSQNLVQLNQLIRLSQQFPWLSTLFKRLNPTFKLLTELDLIADVTGGDSFSDIYGLPRLAQSVAFKRVLWQFCSRFIMLPQTYGPFKAVEAQQLAAEVLSHANPIFTRDQAGLTTIRTILTEHIPAKHIEFIPDVGLLLEPQKPAVAAVLVQTLQQLKSQNKIIIGLNISGLLYNAEYSYEGSQASAEQHFGLHSNYREMMLQVAQYFLQQPNTILVLTPHVFVEKGQRESDPEASAHFYQTLSAQYEHRVLLLDAPVNHREVKYIIGLSDFFMGARMHACVAALSQGIATVGMAYSGKFKGVFESVGMTEQVADLRHLSSTQLLELVEQQFQNRAALRAILHQAIPLAKQRLLHLLDKVAL